MGLEQVKQQILAKAEREAERIASAGKEEARAILQRAKDKSKEQRAAAKKETEEILAAMERRELSLARFEAKKGLLDQKKELVDAVFRQVEEELGHLDGKKREQYLKALLKRAQQQISVKTVYLDAKDKAGREKLDSIVCKQGDMLGGIIAETADGSMRVDYRFEELLQGIKEKDMQEIATILFGK